MPGLMATAMASRAAKRGPSDEERLKGDYYTDINRTGAIGRTLTDRFVSGATAMDPSAAFERSTGAAFDRFKTNVLGRGVRDLRASQSSMGRLDTGFATQDEDRLIEYGLEGLNREVAERALQAQGLDLQRLGLLADAGNTYEERAMSARGGEYQTLRGQRLEEKAQKRSGLGALLGAGITAVGTIAGGPIGGAIANRFIAPKVAAA